MPLALKSMVPLSIFASDPNCDPKSFSVAWLRCSSRNLKDPFANESFNKLLADARAKGALTSLQELVDHARHARLKGPAGFIFHVTRCGSTLVAQLLTELDKVRMLSEPSVLNHVVDTGLPFDRQAVLFNAAARSLGAITEGEDKSCFIKVGTSGPKMVELVRNQFPEVPVLFLYRDPVEVLASLARRPPNWRADSLVGRGICTHEEARIMPLEEVYARTVKLCFQAGILLARSGSLVMNYEELKPEVLPRLLDFFGIDATEKTLSTLRRRMSTDAKDRLKREAFSPDGKRKHAEASPQVKELAEHFLRAEFEALERLRASQAETAPGSREESAA